MSRPESAAPKILASEAARIVGVSADRIRQLERLGLLPSERTESGVRLFDRATVERFAAERRSV